MNVAHGPSRIWVASHYFLVFAFHGSVYNATSAQEQVRRGEVTVQTDHYGDPLPRCAIARLGTTKKRHLQFVQTVAFSPDGKLIATGGSDHRISLWDASTGKEIRTLIGHEGWVTSLAFHASGTILASRGRDDYLRLWDVNAGKQFFSFKLASKMPVAVSPDGKVLITPSQEYNTLHLLDTNTGQIIRRLPGSVHDKLAISPDGRFLATVIAGTNMGYLWKLADGKILRRFYAGGKLPIFSPDGNLYALLFDQVVLVYQTTTGKLALKLQGFEQGQIGDVHFEQSARAIFVTNNRDRTEQQDFCLDSYDVATGKRLRRFKVGPGVQTAAFSPDDTMLALVRIGDGRTSVEVWSHLTNKMLFELKSDEPFPGHFGAPTALSFSPDCTRLASADTHRALIWNVRTGKTIQTMQESAGSVKFSPNGKFLATPVAQGKVCVWDAVTFEEFSSFQVPRHSTYVLAFSPNGKRLAAARSGASIYVEGKGSISVWEIESARDILNIEIESPFASSLAFSPDGRILAAKSSGYTKLWEMPSGRPLANPFAPGSTERGSGEVCFSPDGMLMAACCHDKIHLIQVGSWKRLSLIPARLNAAIFTQDSRVLIAAIQSSVVFIDVATGKELFRVNGHNGPVSSIALSNDGRLLASGSHDQTVLIWDVPRLFDNHLELHLKYLNISDFLKGWDALANDDVATAYKAMYSFANSGSQAIAFLREQLSAADKPRVYPKIDLLIQNLDSDRFSIREAASKELLDIGARTEYQLRNASKETVSPEACRRINDLLHILNERPISRAMYTGDLLRLLRAIQVLELTGSKEAINVLHALSNEASWTPESKHAKAALNRLGNTAIPSGK